LLVPFVAFLAIQNHEQRRRAERAERVTEDVFLRVPFIALRTEERRARLAGAMPDSTEATPTPAIIATSSIINLPSR